MASTSGEGRRRTVLGLLAVSAVLAACGVHPAGGGDPAPAVEDAPSFVVVGDSITAGDEPLVGEDVPGRGSWVPAAEGAPLRFLGGWAVPGSTTQAMVDGVAGQRTPDADVLVLLGGTNDLTVDLPTSQTVAHLEQVAETVDAGQVLLVAVPPKDAQPAQVLALNQVLAAVADDRGWRFVDPWLPVSEQGRYAAGTSLDGVHPVQPVADDAGHRIRDVLLQEEHGRDGAQGGD